MATPVIETYSHSGSANLVTFLWRSKRFVTAKKTAKIMSGSANTVQEMCEIAFGHVDLDWDAHVKVDPKFYRPAEVELLLGDYGKAKTKLDWEPKVSFAELITMMVDADLARVKTEIRNQQEDEVL